MEPSEERSEHYDVVIVGAGLAGLTLARQLLLADPERRIAMLDRRTELPPKQQKYGEATVQVSGYYYSRVLELEEYLLRHHYLKYNLRFYWPSGDGATRYEECSQSFIRGLSNICTYQLDRNTFEGEVLRVNELRPNFHMFRGASGFEVQLGVGQEPHTFQFQQDGKTLTGSARWMVDTTGRVRLMAKRMKLARQSPIRHAASFCWVDGLVDIEKLTDLSPREVRLRPDRQQLGHVPAFLATNHFCGEGYWFWVIPLHGRTSLGLVFDKTKIEWEEVGSAEKMIAWVCRQYPMFARDLPQREVVDYSGLRDFAHDCGQVVSAERWAMAGEAGRFTDPLYSPGGDLISIYNTLISDAIDTKDPDKLAFKVRIYEPLARAVYEAYVPSYAISYDTLGDQESFSLRYAWELTVYFSFYVFPFINDLMTDVSFVPGFLRRFGRLGPINRSLHAVLAAYYLWKRDHGLPMTTPEPTFVDFYEASPLKAAESCFYQVGVGSQRAREILDEQVANLDEFARWIVSYLASVVLGDARVGRSKGFVEGIDFEALTFTPEALAERWAAVPDQDEAYPFRHTYPCMKRFGTLPVSRMEGAMAEEPVMAAAGA